MSLDDQKAKSGRFLAPDAASAPPGARENEKICLEFKATDFVVYPAHGVGQILSIEEQTVAGVSLVLLAARRDVASAAACVISLYLASEASGLAQQGHDPDAGQKHDE